MSLTQDCLTLLVDLTTGHYNMGTQTTSLWLTFLTSVQQSRTLEHTFFVFNSRSMVCIATPTGNMPEASEIQIPPIFQTCSMVVLMVSAVEGFQFITKHVFIEQVFGHLPVLKCYSGSCSTGGCHH